MGGEWRSLQLGPACSKIGSGATPRGGKDSYHANGVALIRSQNVYNEGFKAPGLAYLDEAQANELSNVVVQEGDVLLNITGESVCRVCQAPEYVLPARVNQHVAIIRPKLDILDARFLRYALVAPPMQAHLAALSSAGATRRALTKGMIESLMIQAPSVSEQSAIAHILGTLDDKIELNRRMNETLEAMARALFKSWFVDFDPVRAKAQTPPGMDPATAALFPSEFQDSELGEIPKGWRVAPLKEWVDALSGGTPSKKDDAYWGGDIPWISPKVMTTIHADRAEHYVTEAAIGNGTRLAPAGATLVMVRGMGLHQEVRVSQARRDVTFNQDVKALVATAIEPTLLLYALLDAQQVLLGRVESSGHGTGRLPSDVLLSYPLVMPALGTQEALARPFTDINRHIALLRAESRTLARTRDALLPRLLSGDLSVAQAEQAVEATA